MVSVKNVDKYYGEKESRFQVLKDVNLDISDGDFVVILGASGSGKSTLLNVMSGLDKPDGGEILYDDVEISSLSDGAMTKFRKENVGFVFQQYYLIASLDVEKNVKMGADLAGNKNYREMIEAVGLSDKLRKYPSELSGGEQQRVSIARALAKDSRYLFMDEPTGALDEKTGRQVLDFIFKLHEKIGFTLIMVTHNENIAQMANTVVKMNSGEITEIIKNNDIKDAYEIGW
ncbi:MAG: ABC transporter ATP-binding protein [Lachnospiraceae bacterium]|nr:ABC transporter ATP-binding protein [Lachnospiraceae bacterium]